MSPQTFTVFGAGGGTGLECVKRLLAVNPSDNVRAVVRDPTKYSDVLPKVSPQRSTYMPPNEGSGAAHESMQLCLWPTMTCKRAATSAMLLSGQAAGGGGW